MIFAERGQRLAVALWRVGRCLALPGAALLADRPFSGNERTRNFELLGGVENNDLLERNLRQVNGLVRLRLANHPANPREQIVHAGRILCAGRLFGVVTRDLLRQLRVGLAHVNHQPGEGIAQILNLVRF